MNKAKEIFTVEEIIYLKSELNLRALDIAQRLLEITTEQAPNKKEIEQLKEKEQIIQRIYDKLKEN